jgi:hypothetical protein
MSVSGQGVDVRKLRFSNGAPAVLFTIMATMIATFVGAKMITEKSSQHIIQAEINRRLFDVTRQRSQGSLGAEKGLSLNRGVKPINGSSYLRFLILRQYAVHDSNGGLLLSLDKRF